VQRFNAKSQSCEETMQFEKTPYNFSPEASRRLIREGSPE
jgi:hypothetical protein